MQSDLEPDAAVSDAARWLAATPDHAGRAIVPELKTRFGLTSLQAVAAIREANLLREATYEKDS